MSDGAALHFAGDGAEGVTDTDLLLGGVDELVAGGDRAALDGQISREGVLCFDEVLADVQNVISPVILVGGYATFDLFCSSSGT